MSPKDNFILELQAWPKTDPIFSLSNWYNHENLERICWLEWKYHAAKLDMAQNLTQNNKLWWPWACQSDVPLWFGKNSSHLLKRECADKKWSCQPLCKCQSVPLFPHPPPTPLPISTPKFPNTVCLSPVVEHNEVTPHKTENGFVNMYGRNVS